MLDAACGDGRDRGGWAPSPWCRSRASSGAVALLGRAQQPVRRSDRLGQGQSLGDALPGDGPGGLQDQPVVVVEAEGVAGRASVAGRRVGVEGVGDRGGGDAPLGQLAAGVLVDRDVAPCRVVGRSGACACSGPVARAGRGGAGSPGGPVARRPPPGRGGGLRGSERRFSTTTRSAPSKGRLEGRDIDGRGFDPGQVGARCQSRDEVVDRSSPATVRTVEAQLAEGPGPFGGLRPTPRRAPQPERHHGRHRRVSGGQRYALTSSVPGGPPGHVGADRTCEAGRGGTGGQWSPPPRWPGSGRRRTRPRGTGAAG